MLNDSGQNFKIYKASAGSGKTYTLVKEFLTLCLSSGNFSYKGILAVTFTNKAANEMKSKLLNNLDGIINGNKDYDDMKNDIIRTLKIDEDVLINRAKNLYSSILHNYSDLNVSTIDSFVQQLSRTFSKELNLPNQYRVIIDDEDLLDDIIQRIDDRIGKDDKFITDILSNFLEFKLDEDNSWQLTYPIKDFIKKLFKENAYKKGESLSAEKLTLTKSQYEEVEQSLTYNVNFYKNIIEENIKLIKIFNEKNNVGWDDYIGVLLTSIKKIEKDIYVKPSELTGIVLKAILDGDRKWYKGKKEPSNIDGVDLVSYFRNMIDAQKKLYLINIVRKNLYLYVLRGTLLNIIGEYIEDTNKVYISEFNKRISDVIGDCDAPFIYERIGTRFKHFFIDEFQDTSILQWFNFLPLIHNSLADFNMNLLVGDAKQAIYRFRNGEVEQIIKLPEIHKKPDNKTFATYEAKFEQEISVENLDVNYRSSKNIIDFNNSFFTKTRHVLKNEEYHSVYADDMRQKFSEKIDYPGCVSVEIFKMKDSEGKKKDKSFYKNAVKKSILRDIEVLKEKGFKSKDITILVRNGKDGAEIAEFLAKNNVNVISSDSILLRSSDKVQLIISTLRFMTDEKNDVVRLTCSFYNDMCKSNDDPCNLQGVIGDVVDKDRLYELRNKTFSIYDLCAGLIKMYGFNIISDVFLQYFMGVVHDWQNNENDGISAFLEYWDKKSSSFYVEISGEIDAVQIMTIHKSKGLEFKAVIYPYVITRVPELLHTNEIWMSVEKNFDFLKKDIPYISDFVLPVNGSIEDTPWEAYYLEEIEKASFDDYNVMYVAMTRPKHVLFMYSNDYASKDNPYNFFTDYFKNTDLDFDMSEGEESVIYKLGTVDAFKAKMKESDNMVLELGDEHPVAIDWTETVCIKPDPTMFLADNDEYSPQEWGDLVHEMLSRIETLDDAENVLNTYVNDGCIDLRQAEELKIQFEKIVNIPEISLAYSKDAKVKNEMEIHTKYGDFLRPDRYVELPEKVMVIDYKTGKHNEKYYKKQQDYMLALREMGIEKQIEGYLVYIGEEVYAKPIYLDRLF